MIFSISYRLELVIALLAVVGAMTGLARRDRNTLILTCAFAVPAAFLVLTGMMSHAENRYAFVVLPPAAILAGSAITAISRQMWEKNRLLAITIPVLAALPLLQHDAAYFSTAYNGERWNYRSAADFVQANAKPGDIVYSSMPMPLQYYLRHTGLIVQDLNVGKDAGGLPARRSWLVMEDATRGTSESRELSGWLHTKCDLDAHFPAASPATDYGLSVYFWEGKRQKE
jgi:hypothetical protein